jgi:hypothetical protein
MRLSQQDSRREGESQGQERSWLSRNRDQLAVGVLTSLAVTGVLAAIGAGGLVWIIVLGAVLLAALSYLAGSLSARRRPPPPPPQPPTPPLSQSAAVDELNKLTTYAESIADIYYALLQGELDDVETQLLTRPGRLIEQLAGGSVQLAVFTPFEPEQGEGSWHLPYAARISGSECREFEVPLKDSYLERLQARWQPGDKVLTVRDLQAPSTRRAGADLEAFAKAGFQVLQCFPYGPRARGKSRPCLVLLSREPGDFTGVDELYLMLLGSLLGFHALLTGQAAGWGEASG